MCAKCICSIKVPEMHSHFGYNHGYMQCAIIYRNEHIKKIKTLYTMIASALARGTLEVFSQYKIHQLQWTPPTPHIESQTPMVFNNFQENIGDDVKNSRLSCPKW